MDLMLSVYFKFRRARMYLEVGFFVCFSVDCFFKKQLLFLFLSHILCSGATIWRPSYFKPQTKCSTLFIFIGKAVNSCLNSDKTNVGWNHQTRLFHFMIPPQKSDVRTSSDSYSISTLQQSLMLNVYTRDIEKTGKRLLSKQQETFWVICSRSHTYWVLGR